MCNLCGRGRPGHTYHKLLMMCFCLVVGPDSDEGWSEYRTKEGYIYYYNGKTGQSQWEKPDNYSGTSHELSRDEIQVRREKR